MVMKKLLTSLTALAILTAGALTYADNPENLTGYEIARRSDEQNTPKTQSYSATLTITDKNGKTRLREVIIREKDYGDVTKTAIVFLTPKDVKGTGYLTFDYEEKADGTKQDSDNWLFMPALKKVRRISGSEGDGDFMGTDFTYDDMGERGLHKDNWELTGEENLDGKACWVVTATSRNTTEKNPRRVCWFTKDNYTMVRCQFFDRQNRLQRVLTCSEVKNISGYWTTQKMFMENVVTKHSTTLQMHDTILDSPIDDSIFTVAALERQQIK